MDRAELERALEGVDGYFSIDEAWALSCAARDCRAAAPRVVEIGSYKGRSTIAAALALRDRGAGLVVSIDPHAPTGKASYVVEHGTADTFDEYLANVRRAGIEAFVRPIRATSADARAQYDGTPIDLLFIDGSHDLDDVLLDIDTWLPLAADAAILAFNDPYAAGVNGALRARLFAPGIGLQAPYHVNNTLFVSFRRGERTSPGTALELRFYLTVERMGFRLLKLALRGLCESLGIVYVRAGAAR
jgi:MMP 1-O-methyltransferase